MRSGPTRRPRRTTRSWCRRPHQGDLKLKAIAAKNALADSPNAKLVLMNGAAGKTVLDLRNDQAN